MHEDELMTNGLEEEEEALLPDGWQEGDDIFADADDWSGAPKADEQTETTVEDESTQTETTEEAETPTTGEAEDGDGRSAEEETQEEQPGQAEAPVVTPSRILKLKVNHDEHEIDIGKLSDEALIERLQKAAAFDAMREQQQKQKYRQVYQDQIYAGMTEAAARMVAANECGGKSYPLKDEAETPVAPAPAPAAEPKNAAPVRDLNAEVRQLKALYPDFKEMPDDVAKDVAAGKPLLNAYIAHREKQAQKAAASLKKENQILKQNAASAAKAPVKGVTGGGATGTKPVDDFLRGFNDDNW